MSTTRTAALMAIAALLVLLGIAGGVGAHPPADEPPGQGDVHVASAVSPLLQYQGRLTDPSTGEPVTDGVYPMVFGLYDVESGGSALWTETKDVSVQGGLFSTVLGDTTPLDQGLFDGQALWLGVQVGGDAEATPRQLVLPVAYALSLAPGAVISATSSSPALRVNNAGSGEALYVAGPTVLEGDLDVSGSLTGGSHAHSGADITAGTVAEARIVAAIARDSEIMPTVLSSDGAGSGLDADLLDGSDASAFAAAGHVHWGETWAGTGTGLTLYGGATGLYGSGDSYGVYGWSSEGYGAFGLSEFNTGLFGRSAFGAGVQGESDSNYGVYGYSKDSHGVHGESTSSYGGFFVGGNDQLDLVLGGATGGINTDPTDQDSNLYLSSNNDVHVRLDNDGGENGVFRIKNSSANDVCTVDESGNLSVGGKVTGGDQTALPIAYGVVLANGDLRSGSPNVSSTWSATDSRYEITLSGYNYFWLDYITVVTLFETCDHTYTVRTGSVSDDLLVYIYDGTGTRVQCDFQFVTYKP